MGIPSWLVTVGMPTQYRTGLRVTIIVAQASCADKEMNQMNAYSTETITSTDFPAAWNHYADLYNELAEKMQEAGLSLKLLRDVVDAAREVQRVW